MSRWQCLGEMRKSSWFWDEFFLDSLGDLQLPRYVTWWHDPEARNVQISGACANSTAPWLDVRSNGWCMSFAHQKTRLLFLLPQKGNGRGKLWLVEVVQIESCVFPCLLVSSLHQNFSSPTHLWKVQSVQRRWRVLTKNRQPPSCEQVLCVWSMQHWRSGQLLD